ncbi:mitogen-activated protein kinase kinase kinase 18-like [Phoenix dactylifera]|uniref:Mitogen-activated protein kinase kinase kinase 18-like n=1 Tax=Phoenix dactylifera TaxID=42345 RepID=A0A8B8J5U3_PHODC|nr:mitogen-activated protein kinase kinase kinase 18-like [Phoenix dactylifera]
MEGGVGLPWRSWVRGRRIGEGSFGAVCLAVDRSNAQVFAVKSVNLNSSPLSSTEALENEIQILRSVSSPYIVSYLGDDTTQESPTNLWRNLHLEYMPGGTVADLAARNGAIAELEVRSYTRCIAHALHYLHSVAGVVHCDVKGRNVLVGLSPGVAKLADFGSATRISSIDGDKQYTRGTPLWMAPEVVRGERPTTASDIWSLGCTVIEMLTGAQPWRSSGPDALFRVGFGDEVPEFPVRLSKTGRDFLDKCLRRDSTERWTGEQLLQHPFLADDDLNATGPSPRSVLDRVKLESCDDEGNSSANYIHGMDSDEVMNRARERVRELALDGTVVSWESDGWEAVRSAGEPGPVGGGEGIYREYLDCFGEEPGEWGGSGGEASAAVTAGWLPIHAKAFDTLSHRNDDNENLDASCI